MPAPALEVSYRLAERDVRAAYFWTFRRLPAWRKALLAGFLLGLCGLAALVAGPVVALPLAASLLLLLGVVAPWLTGRQLRSNPLAREPLTLRVAPDGLFTVHPRTGESRVRWEAVTRVADTGAHLVLDVGPACVFLIPRSAFGDPAAADAFLRAAEEFRRQGTVEKDPATA